MEMVEGLAPPAACGPWGGRAQDSGGGEGAWSGERGVFGLFFSSPLLLLPSTASGSEGTRALAWPELAPRRTGVHPLALS